MTGTGTANDPRYPTPSRTHPPMDFFQNQEKARKKTGLLVAYFVVAVVGIIASIYLVVAGLFLFADTDDDRAAVRALTVAEQFWNPALFGAVAVATAALVGGGSLYKVAALSGGGHTVAELLGGRPIPPDTTDLDERRVLNVVEEMAIAAGTPVPPVYLLDKEKGINAFAAGFTTGDAVIGVTRGTVNTLSRDELQGVIAHEFSHILNGDMRLNIRLMGVLYGILLISLTGWIILRSTTGFYYRLGARDNKKGGNPLPLLGLALIVIGWVGVFFGRLIKAAVSRQREYLADASAVQFTRNPDGIAGALKKIGALSAGSKIKDPEAEEASHMFFGNALGGTALFGLLASHPPLADRIRRIDPSFDGDFSQVSLVPPTHRLAAAQAELSRSRQSAAQPRMRFNPAEAITRIGTLGPAQLAYASTLLESIPDGLTDAARAPYRARSLVFAMLLDDDERGTFPATRRALPERRRGGLRGNAENRATGPEARPPIPAPTRRDGPARVAADVGGPVPDVCCQCPGVDRGGQSGGPLRVRPEPHALATFGSPPRRGQAGGGTIPQRRSAGRADRRHPLRPGPRRPGRPRRRRPRLRRGRAGPELARGHAPVPGQRCDRPATDRRRAEPPWRPPRPN